MTSLARNPFEVRAIEINCASCGKLCQSISVAGMQTSLCNECAAVQERDRLATEKAKRITDRMASAGIPARSAAFQAENQPLIQAIATGDRGLYVWGPTGRGKTVFAANVAKAFIDADLGSVRFLTANRLICEAQQTYSHASQVSPLEYADRLSRVGLLVVDDIGRQKVTEDAKRILFEIVDQRAKSGAKMVFTSEKSLDGIAELIDEAFTGRILESCQILQMHGKNWRLPLFQN